MDKSPARKQAKNIATVTGGASRTKSNRDPAWGKLLEKVAMIMRGKKSEVCGLSDLDAAFFLAEQEAASKIGANMDWDAPHLNALRDQTVVEYAVLTDIAESADNYSCENPTKTNWYAQQVLSKGERAAMRERAANGGKTMTELVGEYRKTSPNLYK